MQQNRHTLRTSQHFTKSHLPCTEAWATSRLYSIFAPFYQTQGFPILHERSHHTHHGLHWCSHNWITLTSCTACGRSWRNAITHRRNTTCNHALATNSSEDVIHFYRYLCTHVLIAHEQFLLLIDVPTTGLHMTTWNIWSLKSGYTSWKPLSMLHHKQWMFGHNTWWNQGSGNYRRSVQNRPKG